MNQNELAAVAAKFALIRLALKHAEAAIPHPDHVACQFQLVVDDMAAILKSLRTIGPARPVTVPRSIA